MNSIKTNGKRMGLIVYMAGMIGVGAILVSVSCSSTNKTSDDAAATENRDAVLDGKAPILSESQPEVSLRADRSELDQFRKEIPDEVKKQNDEIALMMSYVVRDSEEDPQRLRDRFNTALRKKREAVDKQIRRVREDFSKRERKERETFLKKMKEQRDDFVGRKRSADDRKRFFEDQEEKRKAFMADQQEKRKDFEMRVQDERKNVEDLIRERQNAFNQEWRSYQTRYTERRRQLDSKRKMEQKSRDLEKSGKPVSPVTPVLPMEASDGPELGDGPESYRTGKPTPVPANPSRPTDPMKEFDQIPPGPGTPLAPGKKGP